MERRSRCSSCGFDAACSHEHVVAHGCGSSVSGIGFYRSEFESIIREITIAEYLNNDAIRDTIENIERLMA